MVVPNGAVWSREFDASGLLQFTEDPLGCRFGYRYNARGQVDSVHDPLGRTLRIEYDRQGLPSSEIDWNGARTSFAHDRLGRLVEVSRADGTSYRFVRDAAGRLRRLVRPDGSERHYSFDDAGSLRAVRDEQGAVWTFEHAFPGRLTRQVAPDGSAYEWQYDLEGRVQAIRNASGELAAFEWDNAGRVIRERRFDGVERTFTYATAGQSHDEHWPDGSVVRIEIDALGQVVKHVDRDGHVTSFEYDGVGRVMRGENTNATVSFAYDIAGRLQEEHVQTRPAADVPATRSVIRSVYNTRGRRVRRARDGGAEIKFDHDANGWLNRVVLANNDQIVISRDALGRPRRTELPGSLVVAYDYDPIGRVVSQEAQGTASYRRSYQYSVRGEPLLIAEDSRVLLEATADLKGLPSSVRTVGSAPIHIARNQSGDALTGARGELQTYDAGGRLRTIDREEWGYDERGNVTVQTSASEVRTFSYDGADRLVAVGRNGAQIAQYGYDPFGRRLWKRSNAGVTRFVWDGDRMAAEVGPHGAVDYVFEPFSFVPLARVSGDRVETFHCDHIGTPFMVTDARGNVTWRAEPDLFAGAAPRDHLARAQPLRLQGQYADEETGLHYNRHRFYEPRAGRFLTPDPVGLSGGLDLYAYVPNPLSWIDPFGLAFERPYGNDEVGQVLDDSEGRPSPHNGVDGHPRSRHVGVPNADIQARADAPGPPATVSTFEGSSAQTRAATEALNSPEGQARLRELDADPTLTRRAIRTEVSGETLRVARRGQGYITRQTTRRTTVTVVIDVLDRTPGAERIHVQTCYGS
jgi:RHS repeat-associated protein